MYAQGEKSKTNKSRAVANFIAQKQSGRNSTFQFVDNRPEAVAQRKLKEMANNGPQAKQAVQLQSMSDNHSAQKQQPIQLTSYTSLRDFYATELPGIGTHKAKSLSVRANIAEAEEQLPYVDFLHRSGAQPKVDPNIVREDGKHTIVFDRKNEQGYDEDFLAGSLIHELIHIANFRKYNKHNEEAQGEGKFFNFHVEEAGEERGEVADSGPYANFTEDQRKSIFSQQDILEANWESLYTLLQSEKDDINKSYFDHLDRRVGYGQSLNFIENDTVLFDIVYYMEAKKLRYTDTYDLALKMLNEAKERRNTIGQMVRSVNPDKKKSSWYKGWIKFVDAWPPTIM